MVKFDVIMKRKNIKCKKCGKVIRIFWKKL